MLLGAHVSIAGGLEKAFDRGESLGCTAIQIFSKNQMQWHANPISEPAANIFTQRYTESSIQSVLIHDSYLINLANPDKNNLEKSRLAFADEIERAELLNIPGIVFHPGSHLGAGEDAGISTIVTSLNLLLANYERYSVNLYIENTAGQGSNLGWRFEQLAAMIDGVEQKHRMGICFDTAHAFAAGYDIRTYNSFDNVIRKFDRIIGLKYLKAIHLNDSKKQLASRVDRHDNIGAGEIGKDAFKYLMNTELFDTIPKVLETPGGDTWFTNNLNLLKSMIKTQ
ncbi:deoxyribonuclease IV [candidate division KSB1 bacterium]|nr:deoxyribonuclease IV [candidate division KSB1 bacterium]